MAVTRRRLTGEYLDTTFIYGLIDPRCQAVRYVGKADDPAKRLTGHLGKQSLSKSDYKSRWLNKLLSLGLTPTLVILEEVEYLDWQAAEQRWIAHFRAAGNRLTNGDDGGNGGLAMSPTTRKKLSERRKAWWARQTPEARRAFTQARAERSRGHPVSAETRRKISSAQIGRKAPVSQLRAQSAAQKRLWSRRSPQEREAYTAKFRQAALAPESQARRAKTVRNKKRNDAHTSKYLGVSFYKRDRCWRAWLRLNGKQFHVGYFESEEEAARARDAAIRRLFGDTYRLNFPE